MVLHKLHKFVEIINTYYAFAVLMYVVALYVSSHSQLFWWIIASVTPILAAWSGFLFKSYLDGRNQKHGFKLLSQVMSYEIDDNNLYTLRYTTSLEALANRLMIYPVGYQWSGESEGSIPRILSANHKLVGVINKYDHDSKTAKVRSYSENVPTEEEWDYWFVGFEKALYRGDKALVKYEQEFLDKKRKAKPCLYYVVNTPMEKLELNVKFAKSKMPSRVECSYFKLSDRRKIVKSDGVIFDPEKQWAVWSIEKPKLGYCYRIDWH